MKNIIHLVINFFVLCLIFLCIIFLIFSPIFTAKSLIFPYALTPFDICKQYPNAWHLIKIAYIISFILCYSIVYISITNNIRKLKTTSITNNNEDIEVFDNSKLALKIGQNENGTIKYIHENRFISKYSYNWYYWKWQNFICYVSLY